MHIIFWYFPNTVILNINLIFALIRAAKSPPPANPEILSLWTTAEIFLPECPYVISCHPRFPDSALSRRSRFFFTAYVYFVYTWFRRRYKVYIPVVWYRVGILTVPIPWSWYQVVVVGKHNDIIYDDLRGTCTFVIIIFFKKKSLAAAV